MLSYLLLAGGLVLLVVGAEGLVRGASRLALAAGISRLVVGLVIVSIGTSAPELAVSVASAWQGNGDVAMGNIVGSNTFNILFILGIASLVAPVVVRTRLIRLDIPIMVLISLVLMALVLDGGLGRLEGILLLVAAGGYIALNLRLGRREAAQESADISGARSARGILVASGLTLGGLAVLVLGARMAVAGATDVARTLGASDLVIGLTVVAAGTSLPEVATSVLAALRGERDIAVGNIVGSNIVNIALILGLAGLVAPAGLAVATGLQTFDLPFMVAATIAVLPLAVSGQRISRWEGAFFLGYYVAYVTHLVMDATQHPAASEARFALTWFVAPLSLVVLANALLQAWRRPSQPTADGP